MAPITDQTVNDLKAQVAHLERRIYELEQKERGVKPIDKADAMRMILIGPPGAGKLSHQLA
jgi:ribosome-interacting GTPase 1